MKIKHITLCTFLFFFSLSIRAHLAFQGAITPSFILKGKAEQETIQGKFLYKLQGKGFIGELGLNTWGIISGLNFHYEWLKLICQTSPYEGAHVSLISEQLGFSLGYRFQDFPFQIWLEYHPYIVWKKGSSNNIKKSKDYGQGLALASHYSFLSHLALTIFYKQYYLIKSVSPRDDLAPQNTFVEEILLGVSFFY